MNALLAMSSGRYFTWLADDDMYTPAFLLAVYTALLKYDFSPCVFTSYMSGVTFPEKLKISSAEGQLLNGRRFLQLYLSRGLKTQGSFGVFGQYEETRREPLPQIDGLVQERDWFRERDTGPASDGG